MCVRVSVCNYSARMRKGKAIVVATQIARSRVLGICACCNYNKSVDIGEKLVSARFKLLNMAHWRYKSCIFPSACLWFTDRTHSVCDVVRLEAIVYASIIF